MAAAEHGFIAAVLSHGRSYSQFGSVGSQASSAFEQTRRLVLDHGEEAVARDVELQVQQLSAQAPKALKAILLATRTSAYSASIAPTDAQACNAIRSTLFGHLPNWVHSVPADEQQMASELVSAFIPELEQLPTADVVTLMYACLSGMEQNKPHCCTLLELLPPCLVAISTATAAGAAAAGPTDCAGGDAAASDSQAGPAAGADATFYRDTAVARLQHCRWPMEQMGQVLQVLKAVPLTQEQANKLVTKAVKACSSASLQQLPPILYQVLLLSAAGSRSHALTGLIKLFDKLESQPQNQGLRQADGTMPSATLLQVQATLLMHISTLLKYDAALGSEWLKQFKNAGITANHFQLQVVLTMSRHHKLEQQLQQLLKRWVLQACEDEATEGSGCSNSRWMSGLPTLGRGPTLHDLEQALIKAVRCSAFASELVCPGLLQLSAALMATPCSCPLHIVLAARQGKKGSLQQQASAGARAVRLGLLLLQEVFEVHAEARGEVLKLAQGQLSCSNLDTALPHVLLLSSICRDQPALLSSYVPQIKDCLASFAGLSSDAALVLLLALWPLCRVRSDLQDHVIMLLRKMMYRQDVGGRLVAIRGFLCLILQHLLDSPAANTAALSGSEASCSQASLSQVSSLSGSGGINLLQELAAVLRRALGQQAPVREALYKGLLQVLEADPASQELLSELLLPHLRGLMVEDDQQLPPLQLQRCAALVNGEAVVVEPLPALLRCIHRLTAAQTEATGGYEAGPSLSSDDQHSSTALQACFARLRSQLCRCSVEHFDLGGPADLNPLTPEGQLGQLHAANLLGCLEVVMGDVVMAAQRMREEVPDADARDGSAVNKLGEELLALFELHSRVYSLAVEGSKAGGKKGGKKGPRAADGSTQDQEDQQPNAGSKRSKPSSGYNPVQKQPPALSAACLAHLCDAIADDGLLALPTDFDVTEPSYHTKLARNEKFRCFVMRSCTNLLEGAQSAAAAAVLLQLESAGGVGHGAAAATPAADEVLKLGPSLFKVATMVMKLTTGCRPAAGGASKKRKDTAAAAAGASPDSDTSQESLELLSATALLQLLKLADATQQLAALFRLVPLEDGSFPAQDVEQEQQGLAAAAAAAGAATGGHGTAAGNAGEQQQGDANAAGMPAAAAAAAAAARQAQSYAAAVAAAVLPRLPQLELCADRLMKYGCIREAQIAVECLAMLGKQLYSLVPAAAVATAAGGSSSPEGSAEQQQQLPAHAALSSWALRALQLDDPEVKTPQLPKALIDMYTRFHGTDDLIPLKVTVLEIQSLVGPASAEATQATQEHGERLPMVTGTKTAQPCAAAPLTYIDEALGQLERLMSGNLKAGVVQEGDSADTSRDRSKLAAAVCKRMQGLLDCISVLVDTVLGQAVIIDQQTRVLTRCYKLLTVVAKAYQLPKSEAGSKQLSAEFEGLVCEVHKNLTHKVYGFLIDDQEAQRTATTKTSLARIKREAKLIPLLVYNIEAWEKQLVVTGKSAGKNLMKDAKRATCRDFKIKDVAPAEGAAAAAAGRQRGGAGGQSAGAAAGPRQAAAAGLGRQGWGGAGSRHQASAAAATAEEGQEEEAATEEEPDEDMGDAEGQENAAPDGDQEMADGDSAGDVAKVLSFNGSKTQGQRAGKPPLGPRW